MIIKDYVMDGGYWKFVNCWYMGCFFMRRLGLRLRGVYLIFYKLWLLYNVFFLNWELKVCVCFNR